MDIVDTGDLDSFVRILFFSLIYFAFMEISICRICNPCSVKNLSEIMKSVRSKTFIGIEWHTMEDYFKNHTAHYLSANYATM